MKVAVSILKLIMIRSTKHSLNGINRDKLASLRLFIAEYRRIIAIIAQDVDRLVFDRHLKQDSTGQNSAYIMMSVWEFIVPTPQKAINRHYIHSQRYNSTKGHSNAVRPTEHKAANHKVRERSMSICGQHAGIDRHNDRD